MTSLLRRLALLLTGLAIAGLPINSTALCLPRAGGAAPAVTAAAGFSVYSGCSTPPATPRAVHYVDPVRGSMSGDGSAAHPWSTFAAVVAAGLISTTPSHWDPVARRTVPANPNAPVRPGDTVWLLSGDHGAVTLTGVQTVGGVTSLVGFNNPVPITVAAAPGATPVLESLHIQGAAGWAFKGLTIQGLNTTGSYATFPNHVPDVWLVDLQGPHNTIMLDHLVVRSTTNAVTATWSMNDWLTRRSSAIRNTGGTCVSITNTAISNVGFGIASQKGASTLLLNNTIDRWQDDGIDYADNGMLIQGNTLTNALEDGDLIHRDGMQAQPATEATVVQNIVIQGNTIIRLADPTIRFPANLQGIDDFDGVYQNVTVANNTIVTSAFQGISYYGAQGLTITGNTVVGDGGKYMPCQDLQPADCAATTVGYFPHTPGIVVQKAKAGTPAAGAIITRNIASGITVDVATTQLTVSRNLCLPLPGLAACQIAMPIGGVMTYHHTPGTVGDHNVIPAFDAAAYFAAFDTTNAVYRLNARRTNPSLLP